jgi:GNAT superfamily N-acetyltransferase
MKIERIESFSIKVFDAVLRLLPQLASDAKLPTKKFFKDFLKSKNSFFFIAKHDDGEIIGMLTIGIYIIPSGTKIWIEDVVVEEAQRGKGYGKELLHFAICFAKSIGAKKINLTSKPIRVAANKLYQELGFVKSETNVYKYIFK